MRVLVPIHSFQPGGVERVALRLASAWSRAGADVHIVVGRDEGPLGREFPELRYDVLQDFDVSTASFETLWMLAKLPARIRQSRPDLIFCAGNTYAVVGAAMRLALGASCPPILLKVSNDLIRRDLPPPARAIYRRWTRLQGRLLDHFIGIATPMRAEIAEAMGVPESRVSIIDNAVLSAEDLEHAPSPAGGRERVRSGRRFIAIGRLVPQKNFALLLRAFARIARPTDRLVILGEGPERRALTRLAHSLGFAEQVAFPGHVADVRRQLADSDLFLLSSDYEGVPGALIEALAAGTPIVATEASASVSFLLDHGAIGRLVPVGAEEAFAAAMDAPALSRPQAARARAECFTVERAAASWLGLFRQLVREREAEAKAECGFASPAASSAQR